MLALATSSETTRPHPITTDTTGRLSTELSGEAAVGGTRSPAQLLTHRTSIKDRERVQHARTLARVTSSRRRRLGTGDWYTAPGWAVRL
jgi:hypothetical protein